MNLVIGLVAAAFVLAIVEARHKGIGVNASLNVQSLPSNRVNVAPPISSAPQIVVGGSMVDNVAMQGAGMALDQLKRFGSAIPVVGGVLESIAGAFLAAHQQRAREATSENAAVDNFITKGFNPGVVQVANAYNARQISADDALRLLDQLWQSYWAEVGPVIQPGRNGCQSGAAIDYAPGHPPSGGPGSWCGRSGWGAACCLGAEQIGSGLGRLGRAILQVDQQGGSQTVAFAPINPNKYSNFSAPGFSVTVYGP